MSHSNILQSLIFFKCTFAWILGPSVCGHTRSVCQHKCVVDLLSESPEFHCAPPETGQMKPQEIPAISCTVPASTLSDPAFAGILSLISKEFLVKANPHHMTENPYLLIIVFSFGTSTHTVTQNSHTLIIQGGSTDGYKLKWLNKKQGHFDQLELVIGAVLISDDS